MSKLITKKLEQAVYPSDIQSDFDILMELSTMIDLYTRLKSTRWFFTQRSDAERDLYFKIEKTIKKLS